MTNINGDEYSQIHCTGFSYNYRKSLIGRYCPDSQLVTTESECKVAADSLGLDYYRITRNDTSLPAGCYWHKAGYSNFNKIIDPSKTKLTSFGSSGGICVNSGKARNKRHLKKILSELKIRILANRM